MQVMQLMMLHCCRSEAIKAKAELQLEEATMIEKAVDRALAAVNEHERKQVKAQRDAAEAAAGACPLQDAYL